MSERFDVLAPSHPGFDHSAINADFDSVDDLAYFYLEFLEELDLSDVLIVGASFGGWIALEMAVKSTERIGKLVLIDSLGLKFGGPTEEDIADIFSMSDADFASLAFSDAQFAPRSGDELTDAELLTVATNREASARFGWLPCLYDPKLRQRLHRAKVHTLAIWGTDDRIAKPSYGRKLASALPRAEYTEIDDAGHFPHQERPAEVAQKVAAFSEVFWKQSEFAVSSES
ncbi:alpha/beta fold hydrolase (plasmid) [Paraburkholderia strydomiana]